jgi:hypothetical protein
MRPQISHSGKAGSPDLPLISSKLMRGYKLGSAGKSYSPAHPFQSRKFIPDDARRLISIEPASFKIIPSPATGFRFGFMKK